MKFQISCETVALLTFLNSEFWREIQIVLNYFSPFVTSKAAGKFIEDMATLAKFVASVNRSNSRLTISFFRVSKAANAWCTAKGQSSSKRILLEFPERKGWLLAFSN